MGPGTDSVSTPWADPDDQFATFSRGPSVTQCPAAISSEMTRVGGRIPSPARTSAGVFLTYLGLGLGLLGFAGALGETHWVGRAAALGAIALGLLALQEALIPEWGSRLALPPRMHHWLHGLTRRATLPAVFSAGVLVGLCTVPWSGAIYVAVLGLLATQATRVEGLGYLALYNAIFVLPLVLMLAVASSRAVFNALGRWQLHHRGALKLVLALASIGLGLLLLITL